MYSTTLFVNPIFLRQRKYTFVKHVVFKIYYCNKTLTTKLQSLYWLQFRKKLLGVVWSWMVISLMPLLTAATINWYRFVHAMVDLFWIFIFWALWFLFKHENSGINLILNPIYIKIYPNMGNALYVQVNDYIKIDINLYIKSYIFKWIIVNFTSFFAASLISINK